MSSSEKASSLNLSHLPWEMVMAPRWKVGDRGGMPLDVAAIVARMAMTPEEVAFELGEDPSIGGWWGVIEVKTGTPLNFPEVGDLWRNPAFYRELIPAKESSPPVWRFYTISKEPLNVEGYRSRGTVHPALNSPRLGIKIVHLMPVV